MDRRRYKRYPLHLQARITLNCDYRDPIRDIRIGRVLQGLVDTLDISLGGFRVAFMTADTDHHIDFTTSEACHLKDRSVTVSFADLELTVWGEIKRVYPDTLQMAIAITMVSDIQSWKELCGEPLAAGA